MWFAVLVHCYEIWPLQNLRVTVNNSWNDVLAVQANKPLMELILGARRQNIKVCNLHPRVWGKQLVPQLSLHFTNLEVGNQIHILYDRTTTGVWQKYIRNMTYIRQEYDIYTTEVWHIYDRSMTEIRQEYDRHITGVSPFVCSHPVDAHLCAEYDKYMTRIWQQYDRSMTNIRQGYDRIMTGVWQIYDKDMTTIWQEYDKSMIQHGVVSAVGILECLVVPLAAPRCSKDLKRQQHHTNTLTSTHKIWQCAWQTKEITWIWQRVW